MTEHMHETIPTQASLGCASAYGMFREDMCDVLPFTDIPAGAWYEEGVRYAYRRGLMAGTSPTLFSPRLPLSRGMAVTILHRLACCPAPTGESRFSDVQPGYYWSQAVIWAAENGIVQGCGQEKFRPEDPVTREQLVALFYRLDQMQKGEEPRNGASLEGFSDARTISRYALPAFQWAWEQGLIQGNRHHLHPHHFATRAQMAVLLLRRRDAAVTTLPGGVR